MNKITLIIISVLSILLIIIILIVNSFRSKTTDQTTIISPTLLPNNVRLGGNQTFQQAISPTQILLSPEQQKAILAHVAARNNYGLTADQQARVDALKQKGIIDTPDFSMQYSADLNQFIVTEKTPNVDQALQQFMQTNNLSDIYTNGSSSLFHITNSNFSVTEKATKNAVIQAESYPKIQLTSASNTNNASSQSSQTVQTSTSQQNTSNVAEVQALGNLFKLFTNYDVEPDQTTDTSISTNPGSTQQSTSTPVSVAVAPLWEAARPEGKQWTQFVIQALQQFGGDMINSTPSDIGEFCPAYSRLSYNQKINVFALFISAISKYESGFNPNDSYHESFGVDSNGLLQLSLGDGYGCNFQTTADTFDPQKNLECGVKILDHWIANDGVIAEGSGGSSRGGARYWSVLRSSHSTRASIASIVRNSSLCQ